MDLWLSSRSEAVVSLLLKSSPFRGLSLELRSAVACQSLLAASQMHPCGNFLEPDLSRQLHGQRK